MAVHLSISRVSCLLHPNLESDSKVVAMPPKKRGRSSKAKKDVDAAPISIANDDNELNLAPPAKKAKGNEEAVDGLFQSPVKKQTKDAQVARTKSLSIPVDEGCPLSCK
jgi:hypothetical protein